MCLSKIQVFSKSGQSFYVGCGVCIQCKTKRLRSWIHRIMEEERVCVSSFFITLTYDNENLEWTEGTDKLGDSLPTLNKKTVQKFIKRLRFYENEKHKENGTTAPSLRYYLVGEYGSKGQRPHYHLLLFNCIYFYHSLSKSWTYGNIHLGDVKAESVAYSLSYMTDKTFKTFKGDPRQKPFSLKSLGIGKSYLHPDTIKWHKENDALYATLDTIKYPLSDYYRKKIWTDDQLRQQLCERVGQELQDKKNEEDRKFIKKFGEQRFSQYIFDKNLQLWRKDQEKAQGGTKLLD